MKNRAIAYYATASSMPDDLFLHVFDTEIKWLHGVKSMVSDHLQPSSFISNCCSLNWFLLEILIKCNDFLLVPWFLLSRQVLKSEMRKDGFKTYKTCSSCGYSLKNINRWISPTGQVIIPSGENELAAAELRSNEVIAMHIIKM